MIWAMGLSLVWPFLAGAAFFVLPGTATDLQSLNLAAGNKEFPGRRRSRSSAPRVRALLLVTRASGKGQARSTLFLLLWALWRLLITDGGSHRLSYNTTVLSRDGFVQSRFSAGGYLDGQNFLNYDHKKGRAELRGRWAERLGAEVWQTVSKDLNETWKELRKLLAEILSLQKEKRGLHSLQETVGCEIREDSQPQGFRLLHFDGELLLSCYPEAHGCTLPQSSTRTLAMEMEKSWDTDGFLSKHYRAHMQGELCRGLRAYLESWTGFMERTVPPAVNVTRSQDSEGMVHLTCRALGFFPRNISVVWFRDEEPMSQDTLESGGIQPDGNGTYYTWETIIIPQGEEQRVKCLVEHSGNHSTHLAPLEPISLQDRDQFQTEPTDHNGLTHPEFQSSCQTQLLSLTGEA
ncbi:MHC class I polypeptide-related sequence B-like isoform X4 [Cervus elaphus]|uniref:MHC class I polypeptide-related sequence B-like isoform X4 n=1 Tax=Cervus elaphus TaxID=9860 RepID=UPI001CC304FC|nr:MHC class I polypeptide-related sequence B-like isoform X4 [Cervus elaphus]